MSLRLARRSNKFRPYCHTPHRFPPCEMNKPLLLIASPDAQKNAGKLKAKACSDEFTYGGREIRVARNLRILLQAGADRLQTRRLARPPVGVTQPRERK